MPRRYSDNYFKGTSKVVAETFNPVISEFDKAIAALEDFRVDWQEQVDLFNTNALKRFNDAVQPIVGQLRTAVDGGFLVAETNDLVALAEGAEVSFYIPPTARIAFRPTPFLAILAPDEREDWAIARTITYNGDSGLLTVEILYLNGSGASRTGWVVSASSGVVEAVYQWMTDVSSMRDQAAASASTAVEAKNQAAAFLAVIAAKASITISAVDPVGPQENDLWVDIS